MFLDSGGMSSAYEAGTRMGGAFELKQVTWAMNQAKQSPEAVRDAVLAAALNSVDVRDWFHVLPWRKGASPLSVLPEYEEYLLDQWRPTRPDVVSLVTEPLAEPVAVAGPVLARLFVSSSVPDTDFTIKLIDVHPPNEDYPRGFAMNLTEGILRCRFHVSFEKPQMLTPGQVYEIQVVAPDTANLFQAGHRIRLDVSSSNFPRFDVNSNTGEAEAETRRVVVATNRVHTEADHPSHVDLWMLDLGNDGG